MYVARAAAARLTSVDIHIGSLVPAHATAMGRVLLASLPDDEPASASGGTDPDRLRALLQQVRVDGYAAVDEELEVGLRSIALPVKGHDGRALAAVNIAMHAGQRGDLGRVEGLLPAMRSAVQAIEGDLATIGPFHRIAVM
jgi:IclR family pca regulon transcriptional regulator